MHKKEEGLFSLVAPRAESIFSRWSAGFSGLFWEFERTKSRLKILNQWRHPLLGENTARLQRDRKSVV